MKQKKSRYAAGGRKLAAIKGYHSLLALRGHGKITKMEFKKRSRELIKAHGKENIIGIS